MADQNLVIPCKTFLAGEYAVLSGGVALGLATKPGFMMTKTTVQNYHPDSAIGLYLHSIGKNLAFNEVVSSAPGGFGKSTAEFLFAWRQNSGFQPSFMPALETYLDLFNRAELKSLRPSGADLLTQALGKVTLIHEDRSQSRSMEWQFADHGFFVISTGFKIATHEHIACLDRNSLKDLKGPSEEVVGHYLSGNVHLFLPALQKWSSLLEQRGYLHADIAKLRNQLQTKFEAFGYQSSAQFLIKPCGALGADVLVIIFEKHLKSQIQSVLAEIGLQIVASDLDLMAGALQA